MEATDSGSKQPRVHRLRVYERWAGNEQFFCGGRLVAGPNWKACLGSALLVSAPAGIFLAFVAPYVMRKVHVIIMVISCILPVLSMLWLFLTACVDPGIIPRQDPDEEFLQGRKPRTREVYVNNHKVVIRYNDTCHFYQPPRAHHCSVNDNCIERFDHHCPWVGTTVGKRNYRTFLLFVYTTTVLCLYVFGCCMAQMFIRHNELVDEAQAHGDNSNQWPKTLGQVVPALVLMGYTFLFFWFVGGLSCFHCYLVGTNQTTYENFRYNHDSRSNPYDRGLLANCAEVWCMPVPPSHINFRAYLDDPPSVKFPDLAQTMMAAGLVPPAAAANVQHMPMAPPPLQLAQQHAPQQHQQQAIPQQYGSAAQYQYGQQQQQQPQIQQWHGAADAGGYPPPQQQQQPVHAGGPLTDSGLNYQQYSPRASPGGQQRSFRAQQQYQQQLAAQYPQGPPAYAPGQQHQQQVVAPQHVTPQLPGQQPHSQPQPQHYEFATGSAGPGNGNGDVPSLYPHASQQFQPSSYQA